MPGWLRIVLLRDRAFWSRSWFHCLGRFALLGFYAYALLLAVLPFLENRLVYGGWTWDAHWTKPHPELNVVDVWLTTDKGDTIHAWWSTPKDWQPRDGAILFAHGSGRNLSGRRGLCTRFRHTFDRMGVLMYDYPGYGKSRGHPDELRCYAAGEAAWAYLTRSKSLLGREIILVGESLGGAMATELATRHPEARMLVLMAAFTSFQDMAEVMMPWVPTKGWVRHKLENREKLRDLRIPVLIAHGTADAVVPMSQAEELLAAAQGPKELVKLANKGHSEVQSSMEFYAAVKQFYQKTAGGT